MMAITLKPNPRVTLEEVPTVSLDPDDLDCCGVNRPVADPEPCCPVYECDCACTISVAGNVIDDSVQSCSVCAVPDVPDKAVDLSVNRAAQVTFDNSSISITDFSDVDEGISGRVYLGALDDQQMRLHYTFAVPAAYVNWGDNFLTFKIKTSGPASENAVQLRILDVDSAERYSTNRVSSTDWLTLNISKAAQSLSVGRWTPGLQMSITIDMFVDAGNEIFVSNGVFSYS